MSELFLSVLAIFSVTLAAYGAGRPVVRGLRVAEDDPLTATVWSFAVGLAAWGTGLGILGLAGCLYRIVIVVLTLLAAFWGIGEILRACLVGCGRHGNARPATDKEEMPGTPRVGPPLWLSRGLLVLAAVAALGSLIGAMAPPTAGDALCYHLELPKRFLDAGELMYLPYHDNSTFPLMTEMWYLWAMALDGGVAAQLVHWVAGILFALAAVVLARPILGARWAGLAGSIVLLTPGVNNQMTAPMNDIALALFATLWLAAWWRAVVNEEGYRWFVLAGVAAGGALATKYLALAFGSAVAVSAAWMFLRRPARRMMLLRGATIATYFAVVIGGMWYVRAAWHRGNPVYPFFSEWNAVGMDAVDADKTFPETKLPLGRGPLGLATAPWQMTMHPERFDGRGHQLGVLFLAVLPGLVFARRLRGLGTLVTVAVAYGVLWFLLRQYSRFLFPVVSLASVMIVWVWMEMRRFPRSALRCAVVVQAVVLAVFAVNSLDRSKHAFKVAVGVESRTDYLKRHEPSFGMAILANYMLRPTDRILCQDNRQFYFNASTVQEKVFRLASHYDRDVAEPGDLSRRLRQAGFTHLVLVENLDGHGEVFDKTLWRLVRTDPTIKPITYCKGRDADGARRRYRLMELGQGRAYTVAGRARGRQTR